MSETKIEVELGDVLEGPYWPEPVRVIAVDSIGNGIKIHGKGTRTKETHSQVLSQKQLKNSVEITKRKAKPEFIGDPKQFKEAIEASRIDLAAEYDTYHALNVSQVDPVPHQLDAVYRYMLHHNQIKFFLADDAGAGKTIMAGLLLKELKQRGIIQNCLIVAPAKLQQQWQTEMDRLFDERFQIIRRAHIKNSLDNPWKENPYSITSMAFAIQSYVKETLKNRHWDLVIVDEAHHLSAYRRGAKEEEEKTDRYKLGRLLRDHTTHFLLMSATPHKGRRDNFQLLLRLLDEDLFAEDQLPREIVHSDKPGTVFLRRMKENMVDIHGNKLFKDRNVHTVNYQIEGKELEFYQDVSDYVENQFQSAWREENRNVQFALIILQRRVASSLRAARISLERRKKGLEDLLEDVNKLREAQEFDKTIDPEDLVEMAERTRWEIEEEALRRLTMSSGKKELKGEIDTLTELINQAEVLENTKEEKKLSELKKLLYGEREDTPFYEGEKLLIFTEAKDTLDFLVENLESWGYEVLTIDGSMNMGQGKDPREGTRLWAQNRFNDPEGPQVLVATEAAGEGINLHRQCRLMINYDIPWNPTRLEQRMGRIHRYGQDEAVHIYNMVASNTREGHVLEKLLEKLKQMRKDMESDRVFDVVSELAEGVSLEKLIKGVISGSRTEEAVDIKLDELDEKGKKSLQRATEKGLATSHIDLTGVREWLQKGKEQRLPPEYIEKFFVESFKLLGGKIEKRQDGLWRIEWVPAHIRNISDELKSKYGEPDTTYRKFTFNKKEAKKVDGAEFFACGHPLFEAVAEKVDEEFHDSLHKGAAYIDPDAKDPYILWFIDQGLQDGNTNSVGEKIFCVKYSSEDNFEKVNEGIIHDLKPVESEIEKEDLNEAIDLYSKKEDAIGWFYNNMLTKYQSKKEEERREVMETIKPSMKQALNAAISDLNKTIRDYKKEAKEEGKDMERPIKNAEKKRDDLIERRDQQLERLEQGKHVIPGEPTVLGPAIVLPPEENRREEYGGMAQDKEVEEIAMNITEKYEKEHGRNPEDVAKENLGFDVRSMKKDEDGKIKEIRYIEVKGRAGKGAVALTENEWTMANRLEDEFWLYIVTNTKENPQLNIIRDPASKLDPDERKVVRYFVDQDIWKNKTEKVK